MPDGVAIFFFENGLCVPNFVTLSPEDPHYMMKSYMPLSCPYRVSEPSVVVNVTSTDLEREGPSRNRVFIYFIFFALKLLFGYSAVFDFLRFFARSKC